MMRTRNKMRDNKLQMKQFMGTNEICFNRIYVNAIPLEAGITVYGYVRSWRNGKVGFSILEEATSCPDFSNCGVFWVSPEEFAATFKIYGEMVTDDISNDGSTIDKMSNDGRAVDGIKTKEDDGAETCSEIDMTNIQNFRDEMKSAVLKTLPDDEKEGLEMRNTDIVKINDQVLCGLAFDSTRSEACPTFYLNDLYDEFLHGRSLDSIAMDLGNSYIHAMSTMNRDQENALKNNAKLQADDILDRIAIRVVDIGRNQKYLKTVPYMEIDNGIAIVFDVQTITDDKDVWRMPITNSVFESLGVSEKDLFDAAMKNIDKVDPAVLLTLDRSRSGHVKMKNLLENNKRIRNRRTMYMLTNRTGKYGAATLFYSGMTEKISERLEDSFYAIPSSLNEYIIVPDSADVDMEKLRNKLLYDNATMVDQENVFSNNILHYDRQWKQLTCVSDLFRAANADQPNGIC